MRGGVRCQRNRRFTSYFRKSFALAVIRQQLLDQACKRSVAALCGLFCGGFQAGVNAQIDLRGFHFFRHV